MTPYFEGVKKRKGKIPRGLGPGNLISGRQRLAMKDKVLSATEKKGRYSISDRWLNERGLGRGRLRAFIFYDP